MAIGHCSGSKTTRENRPPFFCQAFIAVNTHINKDNKDNSNCCLRLWLSERFPTFYFILSTVSLSFSIN